MTVKDLISKLSRLDPDLKVIGYDSLRKHDFCITKVKTDVVVDRGVADGFTKEYALKSFYTSDVSVCDGEPLGTEVVVLF